jgi:hypothetical protein
MDHALSEKSFLLSYQEISAENHTTIERIFNEAMQTLWADDRLQFLVTRVAQDMKRATAGLPVIHATCAAHALGRFCQTIRVFYSNAEKLCGQWEENLCESKPYVGHYTQFKHL